jgi:hypothetical protein
MSVPTLLDGSKSLDADEEKIRKKKSYSGFKHCEIIHEFALSFRFVVSCNGATFACSYGRGNFFLKME